MITEDGMHLEAAFNKSMANEGNTSAEFSVIKNGVTNIPVVNFELSTTDENILILDLSEKLSQGDVITLSYSAGNLASEDGGVLETFELQNVINYLDYFAGVNQLPGIIEAEDYFDMSGIQTEETSDVGGGINVGWIDDNDWLEYKVDLLYSGTYYFKFRVASESSGGIIKFLIDGTELFSRSIPVTGGWQSWTTVSTIDDLEKGEFTIRLLAEKGGFNLNWFELVTITGTELDNETVTNYKLYENYPNPFNPSTKIKYSIPLSGNVKITVYDVLGKEIIKLVDEYKNANSYEVEFNSIDLSSGIYFYNKKSRNYSATKKWYYSSSYGTHKNQLKFLFLIFIKS